VLTRRIAALVALTLAFGVAVAACSSPSSSSSAHIASQNPAPAESATPGPVEPGDITLEFAGDVHFMGRTATLLQQDPATAFGPIATVLSDADVTAVNLETAVTTRGTEQPKTFHFRAPATAFDAIRAAGIDAVTLANNHMLDYGRVGLADTLANAQQAQFPTFGAGADADAAWKPWITTVRGVKIAYIGVSDVQELAASWIATPNRSGLAIANDLARTTAAVKAAKKQADIVVVFMHWGIEEDSCPSAAQKTLAKQLSNAGADIIVGAHAHVLQGSGWLGKTFVAYGMGNFLWWRDVNGPQTGVLKLTIPDGKVSSLTAKFIPALITSTGQPKVATGDAAASILSRYASLRGCAGLSAKPQP
jgi:poly-gamma-glutamate synthesis protein (capsule biosynthesis protein)